MPIGPTIYLSELESMLEDVARGLLYLHTHDRQIIHRDLTAKNVLLTSSLVAKVTDFGNSRIVNLQPGQLARTLSRLPGTLEIFFNTIMLILTIQTDFLVALKWSAVESTLISWRTYCLVE